MRDEMWMKHLIEREELKAEVERLTSCLHAQESVPALYTEINKLKAAVKAAEQMLYDSGFMLGEAHEEISRLKAERHTTKQMLEDVLKKYGVGTITPHHGLGRSGAT
jgi:uncharacterized small protein (DUF1192 family)